MTRDKSPVIQINVAIGQNGHGFCIAKESISSQPNSRDFVASGDIRTFVILTVYSGAQPSPQTTKDLSVSQFCEQLGIIKEFEISRRLAARCFADSVLRFSVETDSESGDRWISIDVPSKGKTAADTITSYEKFVNELVREIPSDKRRYFCLSFDFSS